MNELHENFKKRLKIQVPHRIQRTKEYSNWTEKQTNKQNKTKKPTTEKFNSRLDETKEKICEPDDRELT